MKLFNNLPIMQNGRLKNLRRPMEPWYRDLHPDDHNLRKIMRVRHHLYLI